MTKKKNTGKNRIDPHKPLTDAEWDAMGPWMHGIDGLPKEIQAAIRRMGRPKLESPKQKVTVRLDADLVSALRATGPGWQTRANAMLRKEAQSEGWL